MHEMEKQMTNDEMKHLEGALRAKRLELMAQLQGRIRQLSIDEGAHELIDWVQGMSDRDATAGILNRFSATLAQVERALHAIAEDRYGDCLECDEPIPVKRLRSIHWAAYCVRCQERMEEEERAGPAFDSGWAA